MFLASRKISSKTARKRLPKTWKSRNIPRTTWCLSNARNACGINLGGARAESWSVSHDQRCETTLNTDMRQNCIQSTYVRVIREPFRAARKTQVNPDLRVNVDENFIIKQYYISNIAFDTYGYFEDPSLIIIFIKFLLISFSRKRADLQISSDNFASSRQFSAKNNAVFVIPLT